MSPAGGEHLGSAPAGEGTPRHRAVDRAAFVDAMRVAATASPDPRSHAGRVAALELFVARSPSHRRAHVAALSEAALEDEAAWRVSVGLPPMETRLFAGWIDLPSTARVDGVGPIDERVALPDDDDAIPRAAEIIRALRDAPRGGEESERSWDRLEGIALASCGETPASCLGGVGRRRILLILWWALRRERPLAAAVLRRCLALDRSWRVKALEARP